jgi:hypothetical protein
MRVPPVPRTWGPGIPPGTTWRVAQVWGVRKWVPQVSLQRPGMEDMRMEQSYDAAGNVLSDNANTYS